MTVMSPASAARRNGDCPSKLASWRDLHEATYGHRIVSRIRTGAFGKKILDQIAGSLRPPPVVRCRGHNPDFALDRGRGVRL